MRYLLLFLAVVLQIDNAVGYTVSVPQKICMQKELTLNFCAKNPCNLLPYAYCLNNPIRFTDPTGMDVEEDELKRKSLRDWVKDLFSIKIDASSQQTLQQSKQQIERNAAIIQQAADGIHTAADVLSIANPVGSIAKTAASLEQGVTPSGSDIAFAALELLPVVGGEVKVAAKGAKVAGAVLEAGEILRIENAATRIGKPINVVGSRASGTAKVFSDWDYVIEGINSKSWNKIKNSLPGAKSITDNTPKNIDLIKTPLDKTKSHITINPRK